MCPLVFLRFIRIWRSCYGRISYSFYINNTKNGHYIAFVLTIGTTTTDSGETLDIESKLFYRTYYVPAKEVCDVLGLNFEFYDQCRRRHLRRTHFGFQSKIHLNRACQNVQPDQKAFDRGHHVRR